MESTQSHLGLSIEDGESFGVESKDNFSFDVNNFELHELKPNVRSSFESAVNYLKTNPDKSLVLNGQYLPNEKNESIYPDLGIARATALKNWFMKEGVSADRISLGSEVLKDSLKLLRDTIWGGTALSFVTKETVVSKEDETPSKPVIDDAIVSKLKADPMVLYFETNAASLNPTSEQRKDFAAISKYLSLNKEAKLLINGHADNVGNDDHNLNLSKNRAEFAKSVLIKNGVSSSQMEAQAFGSKKPIASNATEDGKAKNRRVEITFQ
jgi:outer membrane protein OmpA-like peptidoglycan-associated protein